MTLTTNEKTGFDTIDCDICGQWPEVVFNITVTRRFYLRKKKLVPLSSWYEICAECCLSFVNYLPDGVTKIEMEENT